MDNQKLQSLHQTQTGIPEEWKEHFYIKRIDEEDIKISLIERDAILKALNGGQRFIQIGKYTLMLNSIKSIDPIYEPDNTPPMPHEENELVDGVVVEKKESKKLRELWKTLYSNKLLKRKSI